MPPRACSPASAQLLRTAAGDRAKDVHQRPSPRAGEPAGRGVGHFRNGPRAPSVASLYRAARPWHKLRMPTQPSKSLETFANPAPQRDYEISFDCPEFTCLCPLTGQPDFATIKIRYVPDQRCVELKSLKLYLWSYRNEGAFHEAVTNRILDDLVAAVAPRRAVVEGHFVVRGGITTVVTASHDKARRS